MAARDDQEAPETTATERSPARSSDVTRTWDPDPLIDAARLVVGATSLGLDRLASWLGSRRGPPEEADASPPVEEEPSLSDAVVGLAAQTVRTTLSFGLRAADRAGRGIRAAVGGVSGAVERATPDFLDEPIDRARERASERIRGIGETGRRELARSRALAQAAIDEGLDALFVRLAGSRELQLVIRTQTSSAAEESVDHLRDRVAGLDDRLESSTRRLLRRRPKPTTSSTS
jgi:hypothetical protein